MIKVVILHPPMYPMNHVLFDELGKYVELVVYSFGNHPKLHKNWLASSYQKEAKNYKIIILGNGPTTFQMQFNLKAFLSLIKEKPDIVMSVAFWIPSLYSSLLRKIFNFKFIIITDAISITEKDISKLKILLRKFICTNTDVIISASDLTTEYIKTLSDKVLIRKSLQTVDVSAWLSKLNELADKNQLKEELNLPRDKIILLGVGGFILKKNWKSILQQISLLENCIVVLVGDGKLKNEYIKIIKQKDLKKKIYIVTRKEGDELKKYFKASDIFIFPSLYDQFGYVVLEALASRLPVVCSRNSGASTVIKNAVNGYIIDPNQSYLNEIKLIISNLEVMSENTVVSIERHTLESKAKEYYKILTKVMP